MVDSRITKLGIVEVQRVSRRRTASARSTARLTARRAADLHRIVGAVPGPVTSRVSRGTNDLLAEYKRLGLRHIVLEFRRDDLGRMLEILDLVAGTIRPAVDAA